MADISAWVTNLIFLTLFAAFLDLLLPNSGMKGFIRMIVGFFVLLAILEPVEAFMEKAVDWQPISAAAVKSHPADFSPGARESFIRAAYRQKLERTFAVIAANVAGVKQASAKVVLRQDEEMEASPRQIERLTIFVQPGEENARAITVQADGGKAKRLPPALAAAVSRGVSEVSQVPAERIAVKAWSR